MRPRPAPTPCARGRGQVGARPLLNPTQTLTSARQTGPASGGMRVRGPAARPDLKWMSVAATAVRPAGSGTSMRVVLPMSLARDTYCRPPHETFVTLHHSDVNGSKACRGTDTLQATAREL